LVEIDTERCKGCGLCVEACPRKILALSTAEFNKAGHHPAVLLDPDRCIYCLACARLCPDLAITISKEAETV
jgi:2-oxoglutarate ferredoxin oxidoreductase subunit delta